MTARRRIRADARYPTRVAVERSVDIVYNRLERQRDTDLVVVLEYQSGEIRLRSASASTRHGMSYLYERTPDQMLVGTYAYGVPRHELRDDVLATVEASVDPAAPGWYARAWEQRIQYLKTISRRRYKLYGTLDGILLYRVTLDSWAAFASATDKQALAYGPTWMDALAWAKQ